jgi:SM-20-related protein
MPTADFFTRLGLFAEPAFLDAELCRRIRDEMTSASRAPATVREAGDAYGVDEDTRSTKLAHVARETASLVEERLLAVKPSLEGHFDVELQGVQKLGFLIYGEGDYFQRHVDRGAHEDDADFSKARRVSAVIFLNGGSPEPAPGAFGGGALTFYGLLGNGQGSGVGLPLTPEPGLLIAFASDVIHEVTPVTHGERYTVVTWFF